MEGEHVILCNVSNECYNLSWFWDIFLRAQRFLVDVRLQFFMTLMRRCVTSLGVPWSYIRQFCVVLLLLLIRWMSKWISNLCNVITHASALILFSVKTRIGCLFLTVDYIWTPKQHHPTLSMTSHRTFHAWLVSVDATYRLLFAIMCPCVCIRLFSLLSGRLDIFKILVILSIIVCW